MSTEIFGKKVLIVDDDKDNVDAVSYLLKKDGYDIVTALRGNDALQEARDSFFFVILLDVRMPGMNGIEVLKVLQKESSQSLVILFTAHGTREHIRSALAADVYDIIEKPIDNKLLLLRIKNAFQQFNAKIKNEQLEKEMLRKYPYENIVGSSPAMQEVFRMIEKAAPSDICVTITGETGTGKELVARAIHHRSGRSDYPFVEVNAAALPETLLEAELFGHEKGAFTDAHTRKIGYFESCENGSIFLDEIGEISHNVQVKLLRVLQEKKITRLGSTKPIDINVRIITATNKNFEELVEKGIIREDLYYRINAFIIHLPPLRERRGDIKILAEHFIKKHSNKTVTVSDEAMDRLLQYDYPGNVRELESTIIQRALTFQEGNIIRPDDLPKKLMGSSNSSELSDFFNLPWKEAKDKIKKIYTENVLSKTGGNVTRASELSGINRSYLSKQITKLGIKK